jgi:hypothetical protein
MFSESVYNGGAAGGAARVHGQPHRPGLPAQITAVPGLEELARLLRLALVEAERDERAPKTFSA